MENILGTVREGLFLIDRDGRIGGAYSDSLLPLLHTTAPAGQSFEDLLRPLVNERTLLSASKYVGLFWKDSVNEELIESVNPLSQIEVSFQRPQGAAEIRYLSFSFRRARGTGTTTDFVLGAVADITDRVQLQQELDQLRSGTDSHGTVLLQLLRTDPLQLHSFLNNVDVAVRRSNLQLRSPGIKPAELQQKLQGVFREMHTLKGEAAALGLESFVQRTHADRDAAERLRDRPELAGGRVRSGGSQNGRVTASHEHHRQHARARAPSALHGRLGRRYPAGKARRYSHNRLPVRTGPRHRTRADAGTTGSRGGSPRSPQRKAGVRRTRQGTQPIPGAGARHLYPDGSQCRRARH